MSGISPTESSKNGLAACNQDLVDAAVASTFVVSRDIKRAPLRVRQDIPITFHYRKHFWPFLEFL